MDSAQLILFLSALLFCETSSTTLLNPTLKRLKRWGGAGDGNADMSNMFRGTAGVDYPDLKTIPTTSFRCDDQQYEGGLYADVETQCQVYHICHEGRKDSFLCGKGTIFNQQILACDYWYSTECEKAPSFYYVNAEIGNSDSSSNKQYNPQATNRDTINNARIPNQEGHLNGRNWNPGQQHRDPNNNAGIPNQGGRLNGGNFNPGQQHRDPNNDAGIPNQGGRLNGGNFNPGQQQRDANNNAGIPNQGGRGRQLNGGNFNQPTSGQQGNDKSCCCLKNNYAAPWSFPSNNKNKK